jgi:CheY-like chemotaxis protein
MIAFATDTDWWQIFLAPLWGGLVTAALAVAGFFIVWTNRERLAKHGITSAWGISLENVRQQTEQLYGERGPDVIKPKTPREAGVPGIVRAARDLAPLAKNRTALWVDDNPDNNSIEAGILREAGVDVVQVRSSDEAREWFRRGRGADLLITDKYRKTEPPPEPWNAGKNLVTELRSDGKDMPVIFYTSSVKDEDQVMAQQLRASVTTDPVELIPLALLGLAGRAVLESASTRERSIRILTV